MKKITIVSLAALVLATACTKEIAENGIVSGKTFDRIVVTASIPQTKVSFGEAESTRNLVGTWEVGDNVFGFKEGGETTVTFSVASVDSETRTATLDVTSETTFTSGEKIYAIHCPGKTAADISHGVLDVDFSFQQANVVPVLMLSEATVTAEGTLDFHFRNATAIVGVVNPALEINMDGRTLFRAILSGHEIVSSGSVSVVDGALAFTGNAPSKFITKSLNGLELKDNGSGQGTFDKPLYIVLPACPVDKITIVDSKRYIRTYEIGKTASASQYCCIDGKTFASVALPASSKVKVGDITWGNCNLGGDKNTAAGDLYRWSDPGLIYTAGKRTSSGVAAADFLSGYETGFSTPAAGDLYYSGSAYTKYNSTDMKTVLDPVDDVVQLTWPGSGWRIPTKAEYEALFDTATNGLTKTLSTSGVKYTDASDNSVFLPGNQKVSNKGTAFNKYGRYWASTIDAASTNKPDMVQISNDGAAEPSFATQYRYYGFSIRPVKE